MPLVSVENHSEIFDQGSEVRRQIHQARRPAHGQPEETSQITLVAAISASAVTMGATLFPPVAQAHVAELSAARLARCGCRRDPRRAADRSLRSARLQ